MSRIVASSFALVLLPTIASADILPQFVGLFNIFVGLMLTAAVLMMGTGLLVWAVRLGTWPSYRDEAIHLMMQAVVVLFVLVVLLAIVQFVQRYTAMATFLLGVVVLGLVGWFIVAVVMAPEPKKEEH